MVFFSFGQSNWVCPNRRQISHSLFECEQLIWTWYGEEQLKHFFRVSLRFKLRICFFKTSNSVPTFWLVSIDISLAVLIFFTARHCKTNINMSCFLWCNISPDGVGSFIKGLYTFWRIGRIGGLIGLDKTWRYFLVNIGPFCATLFGILHLIFLSTGFWVSWIHCWSMRRVVLTILFVADSSAKLFAGLLLIVLGVRSTPFLLWFNYDTLKSFWLGRLICRAFNQVVIGRLACHAFCQFCF